MELITHREYLAIVELIESEWNEPDRSDHYLMQIAAEIVNSRPGKKGKARKAKQVKDMRIPFKKVEPPKEHQELDPIKLKLSKAKWRVISGLKRKKKTDD